VTYDLRQLARQAGLRRNVTLRPIEITGALKRSLYGLCVRPVQAWEQEVRERILPAYGRALSSLTQDDESDDIEQIIKISEALVEGRTIQVSAEVEDWLKTATKWHEKRWADSIRAGAGVDVFPFINRTESLPKVNIFQKQISGLIKDIDATARKDIEQAIWRGLTEQTPRKEMGKQIAERLGIQRRRANRIAVDQAQKLNGELTRLRMGEAGLKKYKWRHSGKVNYRKEHKARNDKVYELGKPAGDQPGMKIFCACVAMPIIDVQEVEAVAENPYVGLSPKDLDERLSSTFVENKLSPERKVGIAAEIISTGKLTKTALSFHRPKFLQIAVLNRLDIPPVLRVAPTLPKKFGDKLSARIAEMAPKFGVSESRVRSSVGMVRGVLFEGMPESSLAMIESRSAAAVNRVLKKWAKVKDEIDFEDAVALNFWTKTGNDILQRGIRSGRPSPAVLEFKEQLQSALAKWNASGQPVAATYRGLESANYVGRSWKKGSIIELDAFEATSMSRSISDFFGLEQAGWNANTAIIEYRGIRYGRSLNPISEFAGESEVLLPPGTRFRVIDITKTDPDPLFGTETKIVVELLYD